MMVGRGNHHGIDLRPEFLEQLAIIVITLCILELLEVPTTAPFIDVANGDDLAEVRRVLGVARSLPSDPNADDVQHLVRPHIPCPSVSPVGKHSEPRNRGPVQERSTIDR